MRRRYTLAKLILAIVVALILAPLIVCVDAQAQIVFSSNRDGNYEIYVMDIEGKNLRRITNNRDQDRHPSWSPDGKRIVFTTYSGGQDFVPANANADIYVIDADGKNQQRLTNNPRSEWEPSWSPDGKIAFTYSDEQNFAFNPGRIYVMDTDGKNQRRLTNDDLPEWDPSWSPDGKRIAFTSSGGGRFRRIYVMDADGGNEQRLASNPFSEDWDPAWSPDGKRIAFVSWRDGNTDIYVMGTDGENPRRLTKNAAPDWGPSWSPDGKRIAFVSGRDGNWDIYVMNAEGPRWVTRLTKDGSDDMDPAWFTPAVTAEVAPFAVAPVRKKLTRWGWIKQVDK